MKIDRHLKGTSTTCVPIKVYLSKGYAKVQIALAVGKNMGDKRDSIKEREDKRKMERAKKEGARYDE